MIGGRDREFVWVLLLVIGAAPIGLAVEPPREPPVHLRSRYTMQGRIPWAGWYFDSRGGDAGSRVYDDAALELYVDRAKRRVPQADVYPKADAWLFDALDAFPIAGKTVLVVGSQVPFYESLALAREAARVVVVEWQPIQMSAESRFAGGWSTFGRRSSGKQQAMTWAPPRTARSSAEKGVDGYI